jgi:hypothetical protein
VLKKDVLLFALVFFVWGQSGGKSMGFRWGLDVVHVPRPIGFVLGHIWVMKSWFIIT